MRSASRAAKVDDEAHAATGSYGKSPDAEPAHLDQARERRRRPHQQPSVPRFDMRAVVGDEPRKAQGATFARPLSAPSARRDLPEPDAPRMSTAWPPTSTAEA